MPRPQIAVQLYTLRDLTRTDFAGVMKQVAEIGYKGVELAGYGNLAGAAEAKSAIDAAGLQVVGAHIGIETLEQNVDAALDDQQTLGNRNVVVPWLPELRRGTTDAWKQVAHSLQVIGEACATRGMQLSYHNHAFEFDTVDAEGHIAMDILFGETSPAIVKSELDLYWVKRGGRDPVEYLNKLGPRVSLAHLKDMAGADQRFAPVGTGELDFEKILSAMSRLEIPWGIVEQDNCYETPPLEAVRTSFENLNRMGAV